MAYSQTIYVNNTTPAISAENLNKSEKGIADAHSDLLLKLDADFTYQSVGSAADGLYRTDTKAIVYTGGNYRHIMRSVQYGEVYRVKGIDYQTNVFPVVAILDSSDNVISKPYIHQTSGSDENVNNFVFCITDLRAAKVNINGYVNQIGLEKGTQISISDLKEEIDSATASLLTKEEVGYTFINTGTKGDGLFKSTTKEITSTGGNYRYITSPVQYGETYKITGIDNNTTYPVITILDSNNNVIAKPYTHTASGSETVRDFILYISWQNASTIYVNGYNNVSQLDKASIIPMEDVDLNRFYGNNYAKRIIEEQKKNPFAWGTFDKGCIAFVFDDSLSDIDLVESISEELEIPVCFATIPQKLEETTNATGTISTVRKVLEDAQANGNEILCHGSSPLTSTSTDKEVYDVFVTNKKLLVDAGFDVNGIIMIGGDGSETFDYKRGEKYLRLFYDYSDYYGTGLNLPQFTVWRTYINRTKATNHTYVDDCETNKTLLVFATHSITSTSSSAISTTEEILRDLMNYCKTKDVYLLTLKGAYDKFKSSLLENRISVLES